MKSVAGILIVTGTGTGVGKTVTTAALSAAALGSGRSVAVLKPAQTGVGPGEPGDVAEVRRLAGGTVTGVELARYPEPLAPETAARRARMPYVRVAAVAEAAAELAERHDLVLVEGAGGLLVRYNGTGSTLADVARLLEAPVLVVAAAGLGTLNATALTAESLRARGLRGAGVVVGSLPGTPDLATRCNIADLPDTSGLPLCGVLPEGAGSMEPTVFRAAAGSWLSAGLGGCRRAVPAAAASVPGAGAGEPCREEDGRVPGGQLMPALSRQRR